MENYPKNLSCKDKIDAVSCSSLLNVDADTSSDEKAHFSQTLTKKLFLGGEQWSQEENNTDEIQNEPASAVNGYSFTSSSKEENSLTLPSCNTPFSHNNNLVEEKSNLTCTDEKSCCFYLKFPLKVNNNIYPEKSILKGDGMEEYFRQHSSLANSSCSNSFVCNGAVSSQHLSKVNIEDTQSDLSAPYDDQINALNGEEEDEDDGCIYTYKGDNYEANLSHLLETCFSCGLPTTEISGAHHGAVSIQRILNSSPHPNPNPRGNLYSPEMDFLEMDFDPGSNGDGADSDCEDNSVLNVDTRYDSDKHLESLSKLDSNTEPKTNNIPNEIRSLMCRRCEMCMYRDQKVNNTSNMNPKSSVEDKLYKAPYSVLDIRLPSNTLPSESDLPKDLNVDTTSDGGATGGDHSYAKVELPSNGLLNGSHDEVLDKDCLENNLNLAEDFIQDFSDGGDEADDEDDSTSERPPNEVVFPVGRRSSSSSYFCPPIKSNLKSLGPFNPLHSNELDLENSRSDNSKDNEFATERSSHQPGETGPNVVNGLGAVDPVHKIPNHVHKENNNLGSISAPEVSPAKEFSPLEKFSRSISFHNQLSSPKYENVCFSQHNENITNSNEYLCTNCNGVEHCSCRCGQNSEEVSNMEACVDRLSQREKSVFNIASKVGGHATVTLRSPVKLCNSSVQMKQRTPFEKDSGGEASSSQAALSNESTLCMSDSPEDSDHELDLISPLPIKTIHQKSDDPLKDPNTASNEDLSICSTGKELGSNVQKVMIWTEKQATVRQVSQIGRSACGATAVINVLLALDHPRTVKMVTAAIPTRLRADKSGLVDYILSRSNAGTTHEDLIRGTEIISENSISGKFFHMFPKRSFQLSRWLSQWMKKGGVPVAMLNLQVGVHPRQTIPDAWHHQMVFGVGPQGIYLTNPLECVSDSLLSEQLCSDSVLLVRRSDIVSKWDMKDHLIRISLQPDPRWNDMSVLGQVVGVLKEHTAPEMLQGRRHLTSHVSIPAAYQSGMTIFMRSDNPHLPELLDSPQLPLLDEFKP